MSRLETVRTYFIEKVVTAIATDPRLAGLAHPAELFTASGTFDVTADAVGFVRIPTPKNLVARIGAAGDAAERADLQTFLQILLGAVNQVTGGLGTLDTKIVMELAERYAPQIRQHAEQTFAPMSVEDYLNFQDSALAAHYHDASGLQPLTGSVFDLLFENPTIPTLIGLPNPPYRARVPFAATVGIDPSVAPYPANSLSVGRLNLSAADARLGRGHIHPTVYAELKSVPGSLVLNREYDRAAAYPGRFAPLRNNRIHRDPLRESYVRYVRALARVLTGREEREDEGDDEDGPRPTIDLTNRSLMARLDDLLSPVVAAGAVEDRGVVEIDDVAIEPDGEGAEAPAVIPDHGPYLLVYHLFYPVDDEARKRGKINSTNREGHHLAVGLLLEGRAVSVTHGRIQVSHLLLSRGPDNVQVIPFHHPVLTRLRDDGNEAADGLHAVLYTVWRSPLAIAAGAAAGGLTGIIAGSAGAGEEYIAALSTLASIAAGAAASGAWPVAAAAAILFIIVLLMCIFTGCGSDDHDVFEGEPAPGSGSFPLSSDPAYQDPTTHVGPGSATPGGMAADIRLIPHLIDQNLYGLHGGGDDRFVIEDVARLREMLGWVAFPGGLGYPVEREFPGKQDVPGSSWRNYFDIFVDKLIELREARDKVTYFGA